MELLGARYVVGCTLDLAGAGGVIHVRGDSAEITALAARLAVLGPFSQRIFAGHVALGVRCSPDVVEAVADAMEVLATDPTASPHALRQVVDSRREAGWMRIREAALAQGLPVLLDDEGLSVGLGARGATYGSAALPRAFGGLGRVPVALVTGTNGKTTTTRFLAAMAEASGLKVGHTSSDGIFVAGRCVERGDWSGPGAARRVLRHGQVEFAVLETARGGMLRRGVQIDFADVAIVTNVSADHLGEWGVDTVDQMAEVKLLAAEGLRRGGTLVLNADQWRWPELVSGFSARRPDVRVQWFSRARAADACVRGGDLVLGGVTLGPVDAIPLTFGGRAAHNVENALAAALAGGAMGLAAGVIYAGLVGVTPDPEHSAGRANVFEVPVDGGTATVFVDFAHNAEGMRHLASLARSWGARRVLLMAGQAGDRTDALLDAFTNAALGMAPDRVYLKEMAKYLRGRQVGEVVERMRASFAAAGVPTTSWPDELAATAAALADLRAGDFLLLLAHVDAAGVIERVRERLPPVRTESTAACSPPRA